MHHFTFWTWIILRIIKSISGVNPTKNSTHRKKQGKYNVTQMVNITDIGKLLCTTEIRNNVISGQISQKVNVFTH